MPLLPVDRSHDGHSSPVMLSECRPTIGAGSTPTPRHTNPSGVLLHEPTQAFLLNEASSRIRVRGVGGTPADLPAVHQAEPRYRRSARHGLREAAADPA